MTTMIETTQITIQDGVVETILIEKDDAIKLDNLETVYDTYPPPDKNFKYEDPYVTEEEMRQLALERAKNVDEGDTSHENADVPDLQRPRKPSSAYFYFVKKHRVRLQQQHPTWPMKRIISSVATLWSKTSQESRAPFIELAEQDTNRYKKQMAEYSKGGPYKKYEMVRKRRTKIKHHIRTKEVKENISKEAFKLFAKDHGGTENEKSQLWKETGESMKNEYIERAKCLAKTVVTSRSSRKIKLPSRFGESVTSSSGVKTTKQSSFDNFVKSRQTHDSNLSIEGLRSDWNMLTDKEKLEFRTQKSAVDYRALDGGDLFFDSDEEEYVM